MILTVVQKGKQTFIDAKAGGKISNGFHHLIVLVMAMRARMK